MSFVRRGLLSILRNKSKSILLAVLIFILGNVIASAVSIRQSTINVEKNIKQSIGAVATIDLNYEEMKEGDLEKIEHLSLDIIHSVGTNNKVKAYDYITRLAVESATLKPYSIRNEGNSVDEVEAFTLSGVNYAPLLDIQDGKAVLKDTINSRVFSDKEIHEGSNVGIIGEKLAEKNNIHVGDTIVFKSKVLNISAFSENSLNDNNEGEFQQYYFEKDIPIEVVGIIKHLYNRETISVDPKIQVYNTWKEEEKENKIYVPNKVIEKENSFIAEKLVEQDPKTAEKMLEDTEYYAPVYLLKNSDAGDSFRREVEKILPDFYKVITTSDEIDEIAGSILTMKSLSTYTLYITIGATFLILSLLIFLFLRDRKYEVGIYLSLGESRIKIVWQILLEVLMVSLFSITLSLLTGNIIANSVSDSLIVNQMLVEEENNFQVIDKLDSLGYASNLTEDDILSRYEIKFDASYIMLYYSIGGGAVTVSTCVSIIYIIWLNPKKIMMQV